MASEREILADGAGNVGTIEVRDARFEKRRGDLFLIVTLSSGASVAARINPEQAVRCAESLATAIKQTHP